MKFGFRKKGQGPREDFDLYHGTDDYIASTALSDAVNVSIALGRPLLVRGEPGTGKTLLAHSVAEGLDKTLIEWNIKSTSKAADGLYLYDTVARLHDSRFGDRDVTDIRQYIKIGPLGRALSAEERCVLLIDEIDKADIEFPNDLLHELDRMSFAVHETGEVIEARQRPIVIITSNAEKELPDAFLRRCIFHYIDFPGPELMEQIVRVHFPDLQDKLMRQALVKFYWIREQPEIRKRPSTSELIDWIGGLLKGGLDEHALQKHIPFLGTLIKREDDHEHMKGILARVR